MTKIPYQIFSRHVYGLRLRGRQAVTCGRGSRAPATALDVLLGRPWCDSSSLPRRHLSPIFPPQILQMCEDITVMRAEQIRIPGRQSLEVSTFTVLEQKERERMNFMELKKEEWYFCRMKKRKILNFIGLYLIKI